MRAAAYCRVSTVDQEAEGYSLDHQEQIARQEIERRDWEVGLICEEVVSTGKPIEKRRKLRRLLNDLDQGEYGALVITRLDRLCRSSRDTAEILHRASTNNWQLVCLDPPIDLSTPFGRAMAGMAAVFAELERELVSQRTREALAVRRAKGLSCGGMPAFSHQDTINSIVRLKAQGKSNRQVASILNMEGVATARGVEWHPETVRRVWQRATENQEQAA